jgi:hypothetical protein
MGLFNRKPHVQLDVFCKYFFTNQIVSPTVAGIDASTVLVYSVKKSIVSLSPSFATVDDDKLSAEIVLLRFEMFGLAFLHKFGDKMAHHESQFTKNYLTSSGRGDSWDDLIDYNQMISVATAYEFDATTTAGKIAKARIDKMRADEFDKWLSAGFDAECVARVVNRLGSEKSWKGNITPQLLAWKLSQRLGCEETEGSQFGLSATIYGFYEGARGEMDGIKIDI